MSTNAMTDVVNLRRLASELRKEQYTKIPDAKVVLKLSRKLGIISWTKDMIRLNNGFEEMLDFYLADLVEPGED